MGWPKGLKRKSPEDRGVVLPQNGSTVPMPKKHVEVQPSVPWPHPSTFQIGNWYSPTDQQPVVIDLMGRVARWSCIRFEVIKITADIMAVRFEDGSFEAIDSPDFDKFRPVDGPRY